MLAIGFVNGRPSARRAATAYQLRLPGTTAHTDGNITSTSISTSSGSLNGTDGREQVDSLRETSSLPYSVSSPSLESLVLSDRAHESMPSSTDASQNMATIDVLTNDMVNSMNMDEDDHDSHLKQRGSVVDKTNPFIGYFQMGTQQLPPLVPRATSAAPARTLPKLGSTLLFHKQQKLTEWWGSQDNRFPTFFRRDQIVDAVPDEKKASHQQQAHGEKKQKEALINSLKLNGPSLSIQTSDLRKLEVNGSKRDLNQDQAEPQQMDISSQLLKSASRFEQDFEVVASLGQGGQGTVFKVRSKVDGCYYAIKKVTVSKDHEQDEKKLDQALREARSMASMPPHKNVVRYHTAWIEMDAGIEDSTSSTQSVRGSDLGSLNDAENDALCKSSKSYSGDSSFSFGMSSPSVSFDHSFAGFEFAEPSKSIADFTDEVSTSIANVCKRSKTPTPTMALYIQMELCGTIMDTLEQDAETFDGLLNRLKMKSDQSQQQPEIHSNLTTWLRSSADERLSWVTRSRKHEEGLQLFLGVVEGVRHMHSCGVIHRDLKPDNILIHGNVAKIGDFGLSKSVFADNGSNLRDGKSPRERLLDMTNNSNEYNDHTTALGTFTYASPEQLGYRFNETKATSRVKSAKYSIKSDIFALGVILLELCCPFSTMMERSQVLTAVRHGVVPQKSLQQYPTEMALVLRMTAVDPAERPTSEEICEQIRKLLATSSVVSAQTALNELRELQTKLAVAVHQLRDRSQAALHLESLISELSDKVQNVGVVLA